MKISATRENLLFGVSAVQKAVSTKNTLPILSCLKIEAKGGMLYFSATDLEIGIECHVPAEVIIEGVIVVPARYFSEIVRKLPNTTIVLNLVEENNLEIQYENSQLNLKTMNAADFPSLPDVTGENEIHMEAGVFRQMIKQTVFAAGTDEGRPLFTGILCEAEEDKLTMVGTDTHRLALRQGLTKKSPSEKISFLIPAKILSELARLMVDDDEICYISLTKNLACIIFANIKIICRLLEGQFPNYNQVIPTQYKSKLFGNTKNIQDAVERISLFTMSNDNSKTIQIKSEGDQLIFSSQSDLGQGYEKVSVEADGDDVAIAFNSQYLLDVLKNVDCENISMEFTGSLSPCIVRPADNGNFLYLLLPVRS
ncbi:MAG: DNA polymerase III subunit beta [Peptococcia bacterium]